MAGPDRRSPGQRAQPPALSHSGRRRRSCGAAGQPWRLPRPRVRRQWEPTENPEANSRRPSKHLNRRAIGWGIFDNALSPIAVSVKTKEK